MKKITALGIIVILFIFSASIFLAKGKITGFVTNEPILLGYCPTMKQEALEIQKLNNNILLIPKDSTADVIESLKNKQIQVALVGRLTKNSELEYSDKLILGEGHTIVSDTKKLIQKEELKNIIIHTHLDYETAKKYLPDTQIIYHESFEGAVQNGISSGVLIEWKEYDDELELLVVMDGENKVKEFRIPILYSTEFDLNKIKIEV